SRLHRRGGVPGGSCAASGPGARRRAPGGGPVQAGRDSVIDSPVMRPELSDYNHISAGKVREIYEVDDNTLLMVVSDRISAYDHMLDPEIPDKGRVLTAMSVFFFNAIDFPNHLAGPIDDPRIPEEVLGRALIVKKLKMLPFECVA